MARKYWLMKSEPDVYSFEDLQNDEDATTHWDGVRNYVARNNMQAMKKGDRVFFYHSRQSPPAVAGIAEVVRTAYPDHTQFDEGSSYHDPKSDPDDPRWHMVDIRAVEELPAPVTLHEMKDNPKLADMSVTQRGQRVSVLPVEKDEWDEVLRMAREKAKG